MKVALLVDGGFMRKALSVRLKRNPVASELEAECRRVLGHPSLAAFSLLRIYFYDAPPASGTLTNPIDGSVLDLASTTVHTDSTKLLDEIELLPDFALRKGESVVRGWKIGPTALKRLLKKPASPTAKDLVPNIQQKGVDLRIGVDVARLALGHLVDAIVLVSGDSDLVPSLKFARREGLRVYLDHLGLPIRREVRAHVDLIF